MRTDEERIKAMHERAAQLEHERRTLGGRMLGAGCVVVCLVLVVILAVFMPGLSGVFVPAEDPGSMNASFFAGGPAVGYIVIGILAFILGCAVTIFCYRLKKWQQDAADEDGVEPREDQP